MPGRAAGFPAAPRRIGDDGASAEVTGTCLLARRGRVLLRIASPRVIVPPVTPRPSTPDPPDLLAEPLETAVYGTVFAARTAAVHRLKAGDEVILVPDPPGIADPNVWVHAPGGDVVGHLRPDLGATLASWMLDGGRCRAEVTRVGSDDVESWRRLKIRLRPRN